MEVVNHPSYYSLRSEIIYFLNQQKRIKKLRAKPQAVVAKHGLDEVNLVRETSWRGIVDGIAGGYLDAAQMPSGMPTWLTVGGNQNQPLPTVTALTMTRNGNGVTLAQKFYQQGVYDSHQLKRMLLESTEERHIFGMVHPSSMHNILLRYWLAAEGIDPDHDVHLQTIPPAQMIADLDLKAGTIDGYCVGEPWNLRAAMEGVGFTVATDLEVWNGHPGKVLGVKEEWANAYPNTHIALVKALLEACQYCANPENQEEIRGILADRQYLSTKIVFSTAARELGLTDMKYRSEPIKLFDGIEFDAENPIDYLNHLQIKRNITMAEVILDQRPLIVA
jgi:bicarbonate transport system ATP-binding protein